MTLAEARVEVHGRALGRCERCGSALGDSWACHHRKLKVRGQRDDRPSNLVALCHGCHNLAKGSVHLDVAHSLALGWLVASWDDPTRIPVPVAGVGLVWLTPEGGYAYTAPEPTDV